MVFSTLPAAAPLPPPPAPDALPPYPGAALSGELTPIPPSAVYVRPGYEAMRAELEALRSYVSALQSAATSPQIEPAAQLQRTLGREWARAKQYWLPLSLLVVKLRETLAPALRGALTMRLAACCRDVDVVFALPDGGFAVLMLATNRTGAEAERLEIRRALSDALLCERSMLSGDMQPGLGSDGLGSDGLGSDGLGSDGAAGDMLRGGGAIGVGLAVAFDEADSADELLLLAGERARLDLQPCIDGEFRLSEMPLSEDVDSSATTLPRGQHRPMTSSLPADSLPTDSLEMGSFLPASIDDSAFPEDSGAHPTLPVAARTERPSADQLP